jgi:hypothetical protein
MSIHNDTCGCAECGNYGQTFNPRAIHNQSCGCAECGNYPQTSRVQSAAPSASEVVMVAVPVELVDEVLALIARRVAEISASQTKKCKVPTRKTRKA